jgi:hypothetical protein
MSTTFGEPGLLIEMTSDGSLLCMLRNSLDLIFDASTVVFIMQ